MATSGTLDGNALGYRNPKSHKEILKPRVRQQRGGANHGRSEPSLLLSTGRFWKKGQHAEKSDGDDDERDGFGCEQLGRGRSCATR